MGNGQRSAIVRYGGGFIIAFSAVAFCVAAVGCSQSQAAAAQSAPAPTGAPATPEQPPAAPNNFMSGLQTNMLGIGVPAGSETDRVQYLQEFPGTTIAELLNSGPIGQVATLWASADFSKQLELCLDIAASDCAGSTIPGAAGDGHLWSTAVLHIIGFESIEFENASTHLGSISTSGLALAVPVILPVSTVAELPTCDAAIKGAMAAVSDASAPAYNAALTGGGAVSIPVYCNGAAWTAH